MIEKFTSIKQVISKIYRDLHLEDESRFDDMIEWAGEALMQIGAFSQYIHKSEQIVVANYRASIPCDLYKVVGLEYCGYALPKLNGNFDTSFRNTEAVINKSNSFNGYTLNNAYFNFNFESGNVNLAYIGIPVDKEGFPLIPDDVSYREAIMKYVVMKLRYPDFVMENININTWTMIRNDWNYYCGQARGKANMPNADQMESIKNMWNRLKPQMSEHNNFFNNLGDSERITM